MKRQYLALVVLALVALPARPGWAVIKDGNFAISIDGMVSSILSGDSTTPGTAAYGVTEDTVSGAVRLSWFPVKHMELAFRAGATKTSTQWTEVDGALNTVKAGISELTLDMNWIILPDYHVVPYVGAHVGNVWYSSQENDIFGNNVKDSGHSGAVGAQAGCLFFLSKHAGVFVEIRGTSAEYSSGPGGKQTRATATAGFKWVW